ncbi:E3 SUMO-protein ligase nse2 [Ceratobasidium theobromae]|uniref:E3 SUMO-protein ligase nse2 n=1 Tax=Ceratobasidium theobromae TaxID=1582974 RepID=A0A5N5QGG9_9AGAM|nr:E3 SUMO-protein ligase nse2 [Ceratobasidium theobromae]
MSRRVKAEKGLRESTARRSQRTETDSNMDDTRNEQDDEAAKLERVLATIANYPDQPLEPGQDAKLKVASSEINVNNNLYAHALEDLLDTATMLADAMPSDENPFENAEMKRIQKSLLALLDRQHEVELHVDTLDNDIRKPVAAGRQIVDPVSILDAGFKKRLETYRSQTARQKYAKSATFKNFISSVWESYQPDEPAPAVTELLPREEGDVEESDDEMEVGGVTQDYKCPITLQIYTDPLTSTVCGHSYSALAIRDWVRSNNKCPAQGCNANVTLAVLKEDKALQKKAKAAQRRADRDREETESAEEIDD